MNPMVIEPDAQMDIRMAEAFYEERVPGLGRSFESGSGVQLD